MAKDENLNKSVCSTTPLRAIQNIIDNATPVDSSHPDEICEPLARSVPPEEVTPVARSRQSSQKRRIFKRKLTDQGKCKGNVSKKKDIDETESLQNDSIFDTSEFPSRLESPSFIVPPRSNKVIKKKMSFADFASAIQNQQSHLNASNDLGETSIPSLLGTPLEVPLRSLRSKKHNYASKFEEPLRGKKHQEVIRLPGLEESGSGFLETSGIPSNLQSPECVISQNRSIHKSKSRMSTTTFKKNFEEQHEQDSGEIPSLVIPEKVQQVNRLVRKSKARKSTTAFSNVLRTQQNQEEELLTEGCFVDSQSDSRLSYQVNNPSTSLEASKQSAVQSSESDKSRFDPVHEGISSVLRSMKSSIRSPSPMSDTSSSMSGIETNYRSKLDYSDPDLGLLFTKILTPSPLGFDKINRSTSQASIQSSERSTRATRRSKLDDGDPDNVLLFKNTATPSPLNTGEFPRSSSQAFKNSSLPLSKGVIRNSSRNSSRSSISCPTPLPTLAEMDKFPRNSSGASQSSLSSEAIKRKSIHSLESDEDDFILNKSTSPTVRNSSRSTKKSSPATSGIILASGSESETETSLSKQITKSTFTKTPSVIATVDKAKLPYSLSSSGSRKRKTLKLGSPTNKKVSSAIQTIVTNKRLTDEAEVEETPPTLVSKIGEVLEEKRWTEEREKGNELEELSAKARRSTRSSRASNKSSRKSGKQGMSPPNRSPGLKNSTEVAGATAFSKAPLSMSPIRPCEQGAPLMIMATPKSSTSDSTKAGVVTSTSVISPTPKTFKKTPLNPSTPAPFARKRTRSSTQSPVFMKVMKSSVNKAMGSVAQDQQRVPTTPTTSRVCVAKISKDQQQSASATLSTLPVSQTKNVSSSKGLSISNSGKGKSLVVSAFHMEWDDESDQEQRVIPSTPATSRASVAKTSKEQQQLASATLATSPVSITKNVSSSKGLSISNSGKGKSLIKSAFRQMPEPSDTEWEDENEEELLKPRCIDIAFEEIQNDRSKDFVPLEKRLLADPIFQVKVKTQRAKVAAEKAAEEAAAAAKKKMTKKKKVAPRKKVEDNIASVAANKGNLRFYARTKVSKEALNDVHGLVGEWLDFTMEQMENFCIDEGKTSLDSWQDCYRMMERQGIVKNYMEYSGLCHELLLNDECAQLLPTSCPPEYRVLRNEAKNQNR